MVTEQNPAGSSRRKFLGQAAILSSVVIIPRHVLGGKGFTAPSDQITLGFIGTGRQSIGLANNFMKLENTRLIAACDVYQLKLQNFITKADAFYAAKSGQTGLKGIKPFEDFRALLAEKDINAVVIVSPDHWHAVHAIRAAEAGKDIYCEKPLSLTIKEGRAMVRAARKHNRVFQTGSMQRSWPEFRQTAELIRNGYIGEIQSVKVSVGGPPLPYDLPKEELP